MATFGYTNEFTPAGVDGVIEVLELPRLWVPTQTDYPDHPAWLEKSRYQIISGEKRAMLASHNGVPVGVTVYRRHETLPEVLEIRNISVAPGSRGRHIGDFMLHNVMLEGKANDYPGVETAMVDTKVTNIEMISFLMDHGFRIEEIVDLYGLGAGLDAVLTRPLAANEIEQRAH